MISKKLIRKEAKKRNKRIGKGALDKIEDIIKKKIKRIIRTASNQADMSGRKTIKEEDIGG